jgi:chromatin segregation and condensation protein Rec8/ScpA/Scc1 (kleisin family)
LDDRIIEVKRLLAGRKDGVHFVDIFIRKTRLEIVVTFLAVLELTKQRFLKITQSRRFSAILLFAREVYEKEYGNSNSSPGPA